MLCGGRNVGNANSGCSQMSHQLKLNAVHFSKSLEDEKGILEQSTEVLSRESTSAIFPC